jgi:hypothetical protein
MTKQRIEKPIKISGEFPVDLWSVVIDMVSLNTIGPVIVMKKGCPMQNNDSYMLYTIRTKKEMSKVGYSVYKMPEKFIIVALTRSDCMLGLSVEGAKLIDSLETNIQKFKTTSLTRI